MSNSVVDYSVKDFWICKAISQLLKTLINSKGYERAVYHSFDTEKCKTLFPGKSEVIVLLINVY